MSVDVLMVTPNRPAYTKVSLEHLLESWDDYTTTVVQWIGRLRMSACAIQERPAYPRLHIIGVRKKIHRGWARLRRQEAMY